MGIFSKKTIDGKYLQAVAMADVDGDIIDLDNMTKALPVIEYSHHEVHGGSSFSASANNVDLDTDDTLIIAFKTSDTMKHLHMVATMKNTSTSYAEILEAPTITNGTGSEISPTNRNRNSLKESTVSSIEASPVVNEVSINPTITADGTIIEPEYIGVGKNKGSSESRSLTEIILKQNTIYAFRITGLEDNGNATVKLVWYEHTTPE